MKKTEVKLLMKHRKTEHNVPHKKDSLNSDKPLNLQVKVKKLKSLMTEELTNDSLALPRKNILLGEPELVDDPSPKSSSKSNTRRSR